MEQVVELYRAEVERLRAERDAALASERRLWAAVGELREAVGRLESLAVVAREEAGQASHLEDNAFEFPLNDTAASLKRVRALTGSGE